MEREGDQVLPPQPDLSTVGQQINVEKAEGLADKVKLYQPGFSPAANGRSQSKSDAKNGQGHSGSGIYIYDIDSSQERQLSIVPRLFWRIHGAVDASSKSSLRRSRYRRLFVTHFCHKSTADPRLVSPEPTEVNAIGC